MKSVFRQINDILDADYSSDDEDQDDIYNQQMLEVLQEVQKLEADGVYIKPAPEMVEIIDFDARYNIMNQSVRERFKTELLFTENDLFTTPINTTNTMEGYLSNIQFLEEELIQIVVADHNIPKYSCNYGVVTYTGYKEPIKVRTTNRGRKKKEKKKKPRKIQGLGNAFNSQITCCIRSQVTPLDDVQIIPSTHKLYKFKVFRTGRIQLPGAHQHLIDDVIECTKIIVDALNSYLHPFEYNPAILSNIININPVMRNYKFSINMPENYMLDLSELLRIFIYEHHKELNANSIYDFNSANTGSNSWDNIAMYDDLSRPVHPAIFMIKYMRQDTKLSIKFRTPILNKPKKMTRVNIFMRGKINILGAFDTDETRRICDYLYWIITQFYPILIVNEGVSQPRIENNIIPMSNDDAFDFCKQIILGTHLMPDVNDTDYEMIMQMLDNAYNESYNNIDECLGELLSM